LSVSVTLPARGQRVGSLDPQKPIKEFTLTQWTTQAGLSSNNITSIFQSSDGSLWVTSFNGFMIFDGETFEVYDRNTLPILQTDGFYNVTETTPGVLFLASQGTGLIRYEKGKFEVYHPNVGKVSKAIRTLHYDKKGNLYIGSQNAGLFRLKNDTLTAVIHPELQQATILSIVEDAQGNVWVGTDGRGLFKVQQDQVQQFTRSDGLLSNNVQGLTLRGNQLMIATRKGLQLFDGYSFHLFSEVQKSDINTLFLDAANSIWIGTEEGIARWNETSKEWDWLQTKNNIDLVRITSLFQDAEQNLWITSNRSGLLRLKETNIANVTTPAIASNRVYGIGELPDGRVWVATDANELSICSGSQCKSTSIKTNLAGNGVRDLLYENENSIWLATYAGMIHVKNGKETVYNTKWGMPADDFRTVLKDSSGFYWFGTRSGGLIQFKDDKIVRVYSLGNGLESNYVLAVQPAKSGGIWVGTHSGGLTLIKSDGTTQTFHASEDDAGFLIFNVRPDQEGNMWLVANTGPHYLHAQEKTIKPVALASDRRSKTYFDWVEDNAGAVWISTSIGVMKFLKKDVLEHLRTGTAVSFQMFDDQDGMNNKECTGATRSFKSKAGKIYIPTLGGVCIIDPQAANTRVLMPNVQIRKFATDRENLNLFESNHEIAAGAFRYTFDFSVLSFTAPDRNRYRYQLIGFDKDWSPVVADGHVEYTNLPPGDYTFRVIGCNDKQVWNMKGTAVRFTISPHFYQTVWFYILLFSAIGLTLYGIHRWRLALMEKQNQALLKVNSELDRFVYSASHDLRSPLASILGLINVAKKDPEADKTEYLNMIEKSVVKLDSFIADIIDFSRNARLEVAKEKIDFAKIYNDILEDLKFMDQFSKIEKKFIDNTKQDFFSDPKRIRILLANLVANAIKHHMPDQIPDAQLWVEINDNGRGVQVLVKDNGPGIDEKYQQNIFKMFFRATQRTPGSGLGLYIVQETVSKLGGAIEVRSKLNQGAEFLVTLPRLRK
jgi:signal transduction histidine kinase/ligand-binding sensor domain-containing protein